MFGLYDGSQARVRNSNVMLGSELQLTFIRLTEANMLSIKSHYEGQSGSFLAFDIPSTLLAGVTAADYTLTGYLWRYSDPPEIASYCGGLHDVTLTLRSAPPEGVTANGFTLSVTMTLSAGVATVS